MDALRIEDLVRKGSKHRNPVLAHGTSVDAVCMMLSDGYLPGSRNPGASEHPADNGYLFFHPRKSAFKGHPLFNKIMPDWNTRKLEREVGFYAEIHQWYSTMKNMCLSLGFEWDVDFCAYTLFEKNVVDSSPPPEDSFAHYLGNLPVDELKKVKKELLRRRGVVLGLNEKVLELPIEQGVDEPHHEVMIKLPGGLSIDYVDYIRPLGKYEQKKIYEMLRS